MGEPKMFYFGAWDSAGHYLTDERGHSIYREDRGSFPWREGTIDGRLAPHARGCFGDHDQTYAGRRCREDEAPQGVALVHHLNGWTALAFWDRTIDSRPASNSAFFAEGDYTFDQMVDMAKSRFAKRWNRMGFRVVEAQIEAPQHKAGA